VHTANITHRICICTCALCAVTTAATALQFQGELAALEQRYQQQMAELQRGNADELAQVCYTLLYVQLQV
jgi:hypothetical protein